MLIEGDEGRKLEDAYRTIPENVAFARKNLKLNTVTLGAQQNDQWNFVLLPGGFWQITQVNSYLFLTVKDGSTEDGAEVVLEHYTGAACQQFSIQDRTSNAPELFEFLRYFVARHRGKCLRTASSTRGEPILQHTCDFPLEIIRGWFIFSANSETSPEDLANRMIGTDVAL
jgi:hypothetical protein